METYQKRLTKGIFFETALPNEYLVQLGRKDVKPILGGKKLKLFGKYIKVPASVQRLQFRTDNANIHYQGIGIEGYANWRINPQKPEIAIATLDFSNWDSPMDKTNEDLKTICVEAVRHVISNMNIEDAMRMKDEIADKLKSQLKIVEDKWGIVFDQVGIEKVTVMSNKLFADLQSEFRNKIRLESSKNQIAADKEIAKEENLKYEKSQLEKLETNHKIEMQRIENNHKVKGRELEEQQYFAEKERQMKEMQFRKDYEFSLEKEQKKHDLLELEKTLEIKRLETEFQFLSEAVKNEELHNKTIAIQQEIERLKRETQQQYTKEELTKAFIQILPEAFKSIKIENYSVMETGKDGNLSPAGKVLNELLFTLKNSGLEWFTTK